MKENVNAQAYGTQVRFRHNPYSPACRLLNCTTALGEITRNCRETLTSNAAEMQSKRAVTEVPIASPDSNEAQLLQASRNRGATTKASVHKFAQGRWMSSLIPHVPADAQQRRPACVMPKAASCGTCGGHGRRSRWFLASAVQKPDAATKGLISPMKTSAPEWRSWPTMPSRQNQDGLTQLVSTAGCATLPAGLTCALPPAPGIAIEPVAIRYVELQDARTLNHLDPPLITGFNIQNDSQPPHRNRNSENAAAAAAVDYRSAAAD